eukprot:scaffold89351_cov31-Tisochrysis_lutea.AAC.5
MGRNTTEARWALTGGNRRLSEACARATSSHALHARSRAIGNHVRKKIWSFSRNATLPSPLPTLVPPNARGSSAPRKIRVVRYVSY